VTILGPSDFEFLTTFHPDGCRKYGRNMVRTFDELMPPECHLHVYLEWTDDQRDNEAFNELISSSNRIHYHDLHELEPTLVWFKEHYGKFPHARGHVTRKGQQIYDYRFDAVRFANKVFAIYHRFVTQPGPRYRVWIDGDVLVCQTPDPDFWDQIVGEGTYVSYLDRRPWYSECGFVVYDSEHKYHRAFMQGWRELYTKGDLFKLPEWHDSFVFDIVRGGFEAEGYMTSLNLSPPPPPGQLWFHPFINGILGKYFDHLKGPRRKEIGTSFRTDLLKPDRTRWKDAPDNPNLKQGALA
jgi:hypothetical protein